MRGRAKLLTLLYVVVTTAALLADHLIGSPESALNKERAYPKAEYVRFAKMNEEQLMYLARLQARQTETRGGRLGAVEPGRKALITVKRSQDISVVLACIRALRERGADADYIYIDDLLAIYDYPRKYAGRGANVDPIRQPGLQLALAGLQWYHIPRSNFSEATWSLLPPNASALMEESQKSNDAKLMALKRYLEDHPEYDYVFADFWGDPFSDAMQKVIGPKLQYGWRITTPESLIGEEKVPPELSRALEQKALEYIPWIRHVTIDDPEGTHLEFSISEEDAAVWRKGAFQRDYIRYYPTQASRYLYRSHGIKNIVVPETKGVIAGTLGHFLAPMPRLKLQIEGGRVVKVEGGGFQGALMNDIMKKYENVPIPFMPHPGWLYIHHYSLPPGGGASMWGFGVEADIPEMEEFMAQHGIPNTHDFHMDMRFPTYEATVTGGKKILVVDKGHSTLLDDPEIRAIASKYGDPDQVLREEGAIPVPGINAPGDYREYAKDPPKYWLRMREEVRSGKSPYLVTIVPWQLQGIGKPEATGGELASNQSE